MQPFTILVIYTFTVFYTLVYGQTPEEKVKPQENLVITAVNNSIFIPIRPGLFQLNLVSISRQMQHNTVKNGSTLNGVVAVRDGDDKGDEANDHTTRRRFNIFQEKGNSKNKTDEVASKQIDRWQNENLTNSTQQQQSDEKKHLQFDDKGVIKVKINVTNSEIKPTLDINNTNKTIDANKTVIMTKT